jgi:adenine-specific DNA-methyltransferase
VVPFRARGLLVEAPGTSPTLPLLWMQHLRGGALRWPLGPALRHPEHLRAEAPAHLLLPNQPCVLLRRFSPKEEPRRLCAVALLPGALPGPALGVENHLNILHRPGAGMSAEEALGLATWLNSAVMDRTFRALCGHTQVNAAELRALPMPPQDRLELLGRRCQGSGWGEGELEALLGLADEGLPAGQLPSSEGR